MRALIYLRVSTDRQAQKGLSIPAQKERCLQFAKEHGHEVDENNDIYIDDGESGKTTNRTQFKIMLERCREDSSVRVVIVYDISRFARNRMDFADIKKILSRHSIALRSATEGIDDSPSGQMLEGVLSTVAEFFSSQSGEKIKTGMKQKIKEGWWANKAPFGYQNIQERLSTGKVRSWLEVSWVEAKWVQRAFELFTTGNYSLKNLAKQLKNEGFPVRKRKGSTGKLHMSAVERILKDKFYIGVLEWDGEINLNGKHELFLDKNLFEKAQAILEARLGGGSRNRRLFSILKAHCLCGECGSKMTVEEHRLKSGLLVKYLRCLKSKNSERVQCSQRYGLENDYLEQFSKILKLVQLPEGFVQKLRDRIRILFADEQEMYERARTDILDKIGTIKQKKKNLVLQLIDKNASPNDLELFKSVKVDLDTEEKRLQDDLSKSENKISGVLKTIETSLALAANCHYAYTKAPDELKALLVKAFFKKLVIKDKQITQAILNEPLDYICQKKISRYPVFNLASSCGPSENRTRASPMRRVRNTTLL